MDTRLALCDVRGPLADLTEKLSGEDGGIWLRGLNKFLRKENPWEVKFEVWRPLIIGGVPADELLQRFAGADCNVSSWARDLMGKPEFTTLPEPTQIQLAQAKVRDLGFKEEPTTTELFARIKEVGELCPAEVGPHLCLADQDQPAGTGYWIAMEPITDSDGCLVVFVVGRDDGGMRWLGTRCAGPDYRWGLEREFVFCFRKPA